MANQCADVSQGEPPEKISYDIRSLLRTAAELRDNGNDAEANRKEAEARDIFVNLAEKLKKRIYRYAHAHFYEFGTVEDAAMEITIELWRRMSNLSPTYELLERRFNCVFRHAALKAVRTIRRENEMDQNGIPNSGDYIMVSLDNRTASSRDESGKPTLAEYVEDPDSLDAIERVLGSIVAERLLAKVPDQRYARVFNDRMAEMSWQDVAIHSGISEKAARDWYKRAKQCLLDLVGSPDLQERLK